MPKGPQGQKRPADAVTRAVMVAQIATGEIEEDIMIFSQSEIKGRRGGVARSLALDPAERKSIASVALSHRRGRDEASERRRAESSFRSVSARR